MVNRQNFMHVRLSDDELKQIRLAARRAKRTVADYARTELLGPKPSDGSADEQNQQTSGVRQPSGDAQAGRGTHQAQAGQKGSEARRQVVPISKETTAGRKPKKPRGR